MSDRFLLMEIHSKTCACRGGAYAVSAGQTAPCRAAFPDDTVLTSMEQWIALGKPLDAEAHRSALRRIAERRELPRFNVSLNVRLRPVAAGPADPLGMGVTENIGEGGAMLLTTAVLRRGEEVLLEEIEGTIKTRALVEDVASVPGGKKEPVFRLRLRFLDPDGRRQVRKLLFVKARQPE
jgi:hypothetical protein